MQTVLSRSANKAFVGQTAQKSAVRPTVVLRAGASESAPIFDPKGDGYECESLCCSHVQHGL
jgi:hypothetical protein